MVEERTAVLVPLRRGPPAVPVISASVLALVRGFCAVAVDDVAARAVMRATRVGLSALTGGAHGAFRAALMVSAQRPRASRIACTRPMSLNRTIPSAYWTSDKIPVSQSWIAA